MTENDPVNNDPLAPNRLAHDPLAHDPLAEVILALCAAASPGKTIDPAEAAKFYARQRDEDDLAWRTHLTQVRGRAVGLARAGRLVIYRKGKPVDPDDFRGVYRLGLPSGD